MPKDIQYEIRVENEVLRRHTDILTDLTRRAAERVSLGDFLEELVVQVSDSLEIDHVKVLRYRADRGDLFCEAGVGWTPGVVKTTAFPIDMASPPGRAFQTGQPVSIEALDDEPGIRPSRVLREHGIVSLLNVPILVDGAAWGVLESDSSFLRGFSPDTINFMLACAALTGLVIRRAGAEDAQAEALAVAARESQKRGLLLSEMQHRVKNNFQTIMAMISLQTRNFPSDQNRAVFQKLSDNILAMSLAHDQLAPTQTGESVELRTYLRALITGIEKTFDGLTIELEAEDMQVGIDQAVPLGLIVNEAVTNAVKHAFEPEQTGAIRVTLRPIRTGEAMLSITDNGKGIADDKQGSGSKLIDALGRQLRGRVDRDTSDEGTTVCVKFPRSAGSLSPRGQDRSSRGADQRASDRKPL